MREIDGGCPREGTVMNAVAVALQKFEQAVGLGHRQRGARAVAVGDGRDQSGSRRAAAARPSRRTPTNSTGMRTPAHRWTNGDLPPIPGQCPACRDCPCFEAERDGIDDTARSPLREHFAVGPGHARQAGQRRAGRNFLGQFAVGPHPGRRPASRRSRCPRRAARTIPGP